ncbi:sulfur carrier protein ThiS [Fuchsiella alkaliacetigena]|uniref:sulfur carrier protein ThiS n=1 Tax=Fuchsiella alkaliacetigena TaxID=957042 RepID=UPI00200AE549|nr:sulfur carrier protein ThiS [Fuchsiella alkaliacetigena]MCK8824415.1 sulfur carrier protein ThiS [Fuchsiella alkaliacetigena]
MKIQVNGKKVEYENELTVKELLKEEDVDMPEMVSVELNGEILAKDKFDSQLIKDGDQVEFLYFMGGGSNDGLH